MRRIALIAGLWSGVAAAGEPYESAHTPARAGCPHEVGKWAVPSRAGKHCGGWVGGAARNHGRLAGPCDGTFGWDYVGPFLKPSRIFLMFGKDKEMGPYRTDGGPHVPDVGAIRPVRRALESHE